MNSETCLFTYLFFSVEKLRKRNGEHMTYIYTNKITFIVVFCKFVKIIMSFSESWSTIIIIDFEGAELCHS